MAAGRAVAFKASCQLVVVMVCSPNPPVSHLYMYSKLIECHTNGSCPRTYTRLHTLRHARTFTMMW